MTELEKYKIVNECETVEELVEAVLIVSTGNRIQGRNKVFDAEKISRLIPLVINEDLIPNCLTRQYGIRQQALYIKFYRTTKSYGKRLE